MDMQNVSNLQIPEGVVRTIHDKDNRLIWGRVAYNTKYAGDTVQDGTPTPDAPIAVQTVTGEQTVTVSDGIDSETFPISLIGKNLWNPIPYMTGYILNSSGELYALSDGAIWETTNISVGSEYTITLTAPSSGNIRIHAYRADGTWIEQITYKSIGSGTTGSVSFVIPTGTAVLRWGFFIGSTNMQLELGSTATPYVPYYGYELYKIGDYQDYIYKSGDDWYVHKETARVDVSSLTGWFASGSYAYKTRNGMSDILPASSDTATAVGLCNAFSASTTNLVYAGSVDYGFALPAAGGVGILIRNKNVASLADFTTYLSNNPVYGYFVLATPTDTQITDATLLGQLNAVHEWLTRYGYNATISGNLPLIVDRTNL